MRTRILRALAHLKAARAHLKAARNIMDWKDPDAPKTALVATLPSLVEAETSLKLAFADAIAAAVKPARVTP